MILSRSSTLAVISKPAYRVLLNLLGQPQFAQESQFFLHGALGWFTDAPLDELYLFLGTDGRGLGRSRDCPLVPGDRAGDALPPPGVGAGGPPASSLLLLLAMNTALADVVAGVHLGLLLSTKTREINQLKIKVTTVRCT